VLCMLLICRFVHIFFLRQARRRRGGIDKHVP
jgi:hypothetical protein